RGRPRTTRHRRGRRPRRGRLVSCPAVRRRNRDGSSHTKVRTARSRYRNRSTSPTSKSERAASAALSLSTFSRLSPHSSRKPARKEGHTGEPGVPPCYLHHPFHAARHPA